VEFRFQKVLAKHQATTLDGKKAILNELLPVLRPRDVFDPVASEMRRLVIDHLKINETLLDEWVNSKRRRKLDDTQLKGMQTRELGHSQVAVIELEVIALLLLEPARLAERLPAVAAALPPPVEGSLLREFQAICEACVYEDQAILMKYREREEGRVLFERLFTQAASGDFQIDIEDHIEKSLSRLRELYLDGQKERQRTRLLERMQEVSSFLTDPDLPTEQLQQYYAELKEIHTMLAARDAERRMRMPTSLAKNRRH
jgi:hypothetical protein